MHKCSVSFIVIVIHMKSIVILVRLCNRWPENRSYLVSPVDRLKFVECINFYNIFFKTLDSFY